MKETTQWIYSFKYNRDIDNLDGSPLIIELGFRLYYLLLKIKDNLVYDMDEKYLNRILVHLSQRVKASSTVKKGIAIELFDFVHEVFNFSSSCFKRTMKNVSKTRVHLIKENDVVIKLILKFFANHSTQVEILKDDTLQTQYFPILPYWKFDSEEPKEIFLEKVNRTNSKTKWESLIRESDYLIIELKVNYWLTHEQNKIGQILQRNVNLWSDLLMYFWFLLNVIILASYNITNGSRTHDPNLGSLNTNQTKALMSAIGSFTLILISIILFNLLVSEIPIKVKKHRVKMEERDKKIKANGRDYKFGKVGDFYDKFYNIITLIIRIATDIRLLYFIGLFILTILGLAVDPFYYTYLISYLIYRSTTLMYVLQAVWIPKYSIALTIGLLFIVTYILTIVSYTFYATQYPDNTWYSLWSCFIISYDQTFKTGSGVGGYLSAAYYPTGSSESISYGRVIYDNIQYLIIYVLLINMITGIIIDTFGELRQKNYERYIDSKSSCFICEKSLEDLEKLYGTDGFNYHINTHHNLWDYLFFIAYLHTKMKTGKQLNTLELYTYRKIENDDQTWLPCYA